MATYDRDLVIEVCHDLINRAMRNEFDAIPDLAYSKIYRDQEAAIRSLLAAHEAATQEVERLTQDISVIERDRENLCDEVEHLRKLVGEACELATLHINAREEIATGISTETGEGVAYCRDDLARLAAICHAAGVEGKGE